MNRPNPRFRGLGLANGSSQSLFRLRVALASACLLGAGVASLAGVLGTGELPARLLRAVLAAVATSLAVYFWARGYVTSQITPWLAAADQSEALRVRNEALEAANEVLEQLSITDGLTKLHNHRFFQEQLEREIRRARRTGEALAMLICDIDDFKALNDRQGHKAGDELLMGLANKLSECVRETDLLARYGGEEFVILAAHTDLEGGIRVAEKVRTVVENEDFFLDGAEVPTNITVSIGVAEFRGDRGGFFRAADQALYRAKATGKNCVVADGI